MNSPTVVCVTKCCHVCFVYRRLVRWLDCDARVLFWSEVEQRGLCVKLSCDLFKLVQGKLGVGFPHLTDHRRSWLLNLLRKVFVDVFYTKSWPVCEAWTSRFDSNCAVVLLQLSTGTGFCFQVVKFLHTTAEVNKFALKRPIWSNCLLIYSSACVWKSVFLFTTSATLSLSPIHPPPTSPWPCTCL